MPTNNYENRSVVVRVPDFGIARGQDGLSAYEQAVTGGYEGTEAQFNQELSSFKTLHDETETAATAAAESATSAGQSATAAAGSAENAASSASSSATSAAAASASAGSAADSASSAASSAASAAASAASAGNAASTAAQKASEAASSATSASTSETNAASSKDAAADSAAAAAASAAAIEEYEHDAEAWAIGKRGGQDVPSTDGTYHNNSKYYADQAGTSASTAASSAAAASTSENNSASSASSAAASASSASTSAATATEKAGEASTSASAASTSAASAAGSATNAASSATAASASATAAGNAQTAAETAQGKAEDAQEAAEQAQSDAEAAAQSVSQSAAQISQNTSDIGDLKSALTNVNNSVGTVWTQVHGADGGNSYPYEFEAGESYVISTTGAGVSLSTRNEAGGSTVETIGYFDNSSMVFTPTQNAVLLRAGSTSGLVTITICHENTLEGRMLEAEESISLINPKVDEIGTVWEQLHSYTSGRVYQYSFIAGKSYFISADNAVFLATRTTADGANVEEIGSFQNNSLVFTPTYNAEYLRAGSIVESVTITIVPLDTIKGILAQNAYEESKSEYCDSMYYGTGYFNSQGTFIADSAYYTRICPLNSGCSIATVIGLFDKYGNVAFADKSGYIKKWGITDLNGDKYSGDSQKTKVVFNASDYSFIIISSKTATITVKVSGYDSDKIVESYNSLRFSRYGKSCNVHYYQASNNEYGIKTDSDKAINMVEALDLETVQHSFTDPQTGYTYTSMALLDADASTNTRYYCAVKHDSNAYHGVLWKESGDTKTVILRSGQEPPIDFTTYPEYSGCTWLLPTAISNYAEVDFIKHLSDGELLIGMEFMKPVSESVTHILYGVFKTDNNQTSWVPKFCTSSEHYTYNGTNYHSYGYPPKNNSICIEKVLGRNMILISEYGKGTSQYWREQGVSVNGRGVSGKMWLSIDNGDTFKKIFDFDEKINGDASDTSDDNWKWCTSATGRKAIHIHGCCIDTVNNMLWMTNGDCGVTDSHCGLYYCNIADIIQWMLTTGTATDPSDLYPTYTDNEVLPTVIHEYVFQKYINGDSSLPYYANFEAKTGMQAYCFHPMSKMLLLGNDVQRDIVYGIHNDLIDTRSLAQIGTVDVTKNESKNLFLDVVADLNHNESTFPQCFIQREQDGLILMLEYYGIVASFNGVDWRLLHGDNSIIGFLTYYVKDVDGKYVIVNTTDLSNYINTKILNY